MIPCYEPEPEDFEEFGKTKKSGVLGRLKNKNLLGYGKVINEQDAEYALDTTKRSMTSDNWELMKLQLREIVKNEGFFVTSRGRQDEIYILMPHEMAPYNEKKNKAQFRNLKLRQRGLHMIDQSQLTKEQQKKLDFEILKNAKFELEMANELNKRCRY